jgi:threonine/homoserine/homoserine lactone efflux protein
VTTVLPVEPLVLLAFVPAGLALNLTPGADMMFCLGQGLRSGPAAAMAANFGIALGGMTHTLAAGLGLGALLAAHPMAFDIIRWGGVAYLLVLAFQGLRSRGLAGGGVRSGLTPARAFREALMVNLLNPKVILFVLAFLPQFVDPTRAVLPQFLTLGVVFSFGGLVVNGAVGLFAGHLGRRLATSAVFGRWLGRVTAGIFALLALRLALMERG